MTHLFRLIKAYFVLYKLPEQILILPQQLQRGIKVLHHRTPPELQADTAVSAHGPTNLGVLLCPLFSIEHRPRQYDLVRMQTATAHHPVWPAEFYCRDQCARVSDDFETCVGASAVRQALEFGLELVQW